MDSSQCISVIFAIVLFLIIILVLILTGALKSGQENPVDINNVPSFEHSLGHNYIHKI